METFLILNGFEIDASVDEQEKIIFQVASGELEHDDFTAWLRRHVVSKNKLGGRFRVGGQEADKSIERRLSFRAERPWHGCGIVRHSHVPARASGNLRRANTRFLVGKNRLLEMTESAIRNS